MLPDMMQLLVSYDSNLILDLFCDRLVDAIDATTRSNITVGPPFDIATYSKDSLNLNCRCKFEEGDPYLIQLREAWQTGIRNAFETIQTIDLTQQQSLQQQQ